MWGARRASQYWCRGRELGILGLSMGCGGFPWVLVHAGSPPIPPPAPPVGATVEKTPQDWAGSPVLSQEKRPGAGTAFFFVFLFFLLLFLFGFVFNI